MCVNGTTENRLAIKFVEGEEQVCQELVALRKYVHVAEGNEHLIQVEHINSDASRLWLVTPLADSLTGGDTADSYRPLSLDNLLQARAICLKQRPFGSGSVWVEPCWRSITRALPRGRRPRQHSQRAWPLGPRRPWPCSLPGRTGTMPKPQLLPGPEGVPSLTTTSTPSGSHSGRWSQG